MNCKMSVYYYIHFILLTRVGKNVDDFPKEKLFYNVFHLKKNNAVKSVDINVDNFTLKPGSFR